MDKTLKLKLIEIAKENYNDLDPSHDFSHIARVLLNAQTIADTELEVDLDILIPAVLFHDVIAYAKNDPRNKFSTDESANKTEKILLGMIEFPRSKINAVKECIVRTSFSKGLLAETIEQKILQDADMLEATGAISIMRTFTSGGMMKRALYDWLDPFALKRPTDDFKYSLDLFISRLLKVQDRMNTKKGKEIAVRRTIFLKNFLDEFSMELEGK